MDVMPGDRLESCNGLMEPLRVEGIVDKYEIIHRCLRCKLERRVKVSPNDSSDVLVQLAQKRPLP